MKIDSLVIDTTGMCCVELSDVDASKTLSFLLEQFPGRLCSAVGESGPMAPCQFSKPNSTRDEYRVRVCVNL